MMTINDDPEYLALGYLLNQNMLRSDDVVTEVVYDDDLQVVVVRTERHTNFEAKLKKRTQTSGCAQGTAFGDLMGSLEFIDLLRETPPEAAKLASWWSYRAADFRLSNRGLRLDHILVTPGLRDAAFRLGSAACRVHDDVRAWERPSDHAPVTADLVL